MNQYIVFGSPSLGREEINEINSSIKSGWLGTGPKVKKFEKNFIKYKKGKYAVALSSCTSALHLSLIASGIGLGLLGALLVVLPQNGLPSDQPIGWFLLAFVSPIGYAAGNVYTAKFKPADIDSLVGANGMMCGSALVLLIATLASGQWFLLWDEVSLIDGLITVHGVISAVAFTLFFVLVRIAGPVYFSQVAYLVTFFGIGIAMVVFGERYSLWHWAALIVTVYGVWLVNSAQTRTVPAEQEG